MKQVLALTLLALVALSIIQIAGCTAKSTLTPKEGVMVAEFELDAAKTVVDGSRYGQLLKSVDKVLTLARKKPDAIYETSNEKRTMRQVLSDGASTLAGYQGELSKKLELAVETLPPQK